MATIKIKLAVDRARNRVLFADAGSDFVDVLLSFLTLRLSAVQFCVADATSSPGCLSNLCESVSTLRESKVLMVQSCHGMLLTPSHAHEFEGYVYACTDGLCIYYDTFVKNQPDLQGENKSCICWKTMARVVHVYNGAISGRGRFVRYKERFVISDDWTIKPASTSSMQSLPPNFIPDAIFQEFEEVEVCVSWAEVVAMFKVCLSSDTIFTDVFLSKGKGDQKGRVTVKPRINREILNRSNGDSGSGSTPETKIKLFYDRKEKKVMYAESKHEFVDLTLFFLSYPLGCVIKNMTDGAVTSLGGFNNLYISAVELDAAGFITDGYAKNMLNPSLSPFSSQCYTVVEAAVEPKEFYMGLAQYSWKYSSWPSKTPCRGCHRNLVEDRKYVVNDDLMMQQASAMAVSKHWCRRDKANVVEMEISVGKQDVVELLRAVLTSKTPLTDVFISRLEEPPAPTSVKLERK